MVSSPSRIFQKYAEQVRPSIEQALARALDFDTGCPPALREAMRHSLLAPCKRLRPLLVLMASEACGCDRGAAMPAAVAVELVHTYSLIHDDLPAMDDDDLRRGRPSCHAQFGEATAILAGDALLTRAFEVLASELRPAEVAARSAAALARAAGAAGMVGGQADDLQAESAPGDASTLQSIHQRKTGAMFRVSLELGGRAAGAPPEQLDRLDAYGRKLGLAFQIVDDLLDVHGDEVHLGKRTGKDSDRGKLTFPKLLGVERSRQQAAQLMREACTAIDTFGARAGPLVSLACYVLERTE